MQNMAALFIYTQPNVAVQSTASTSNKAIEIITIDTASCTITSVMITSARDLSDNYVLKSRPRVAGKMLTQFY